MTSYPPGEVEIAAHEAAHAAAGLLGGFKVRHADISPTGSRNGCVSFDLTEEQEAQWAADPVARDEIRLRWATAVGIGYYVVPRPGAASSSDYTAVEWIYSRLSTEHQEHFWANLRQRIENMRSSDDFRALHTELTEALLCMERLSGDQIDALAINVLGRPID